MAKFPKDFIFGAATASFQIEGAAFEDGKTPSIWDTFCRTPGKVYMGHNGDIACDHYHRYKDDVKLLKTPGVDAYRFSIAWPRIFPEKGKYNPKGMDFYKRLVDELNKNGIMPAATIYHWDLPQWAYDLGAWVHDDSPKYFEEYSIKLFEELGDSVPMWITLNEPWCSSFLSYYFGHHAPGHTDLREAIKVAHNLLIGHGLAVSDYRSMNIKGGQIGITLNFTPSYPATDKEEDILASKYCDGFNNRWFLDPIFKGSYPEDMIELFESRVGKLNFIKEEDMKVISAKNDFLGINYYTRTLAKYNENNDLKVDAFAGDLPKTEMGWEICPDVLYEFLVRLKNEYTDIPLYITENGAAFDDKVSEDGKVHDKDRVMFLKEHIERVNRFLQEGGNIKGYFCWSFMDNFEWAFGYSKRFGITYVDYNTQNRILKDSAYWYKNLIETREI